MANYPTIAVTTVAEVVRVEVTYGGLKGDPGPSTPEAVLSALATLTPEQIDELRAILGAASVALHPKP